MSKKVIKGEDGKEYVVKEHKKWYKHWSLWIAFIVLVLIFVGGYTAYSNYQYQQDYKATRKYEASDHEDDSNSSESSSDTNNSDSSTGSDKKVELSDGTEVHITNSQSFSTNYGDNTYRGSDLEFTSVTVGTTHPFVYNDIDNGNTKEHGYIAISEKYTAGSEDMTLFDDQAVLNTSDGQQINVDSDDGQSIDDINSGATKKATLLFMVPNLKKTDQFSSIRLKMDAEPQNDDSSSLHTYDVTIPLNANK